MAQERRTVLLVEDHLGDARLIAFELGQAAGGRYHLVHVTRLEDALRELADGGIDLVLLDLSLPDGHGLVSFERVYRAAPDVPVVVLTGLDDERVSLEAVAAGAQDYLVKGRIDGELMTRALAHALERHRRVTELQRIALYDDLTGLYNRRGFKRLAQRQLEAADASGRGFTLLLLDLNGMKWINDTYGHPAGDDALVDTAHTLRAMFRSTDLLARLGGDEFCALLVPGEEPEDEDDLLARLHARFEDHNRTACRPWRLSVCVGVARYDPGRPCILDELIERADARMYEQKRRQGAMNR